MSGSKSSCVKAALDKWSECVSGLQGVLDDGNVDDHIRIIGGVHLPRHFREPGAAFRIDVRLGLVNQRPARSTAKGDMKPVRSGSDVELLCAGGKWQ